ncbi:Aminoacylase-1 [Eumeta japonica]|uniref:Aminoacylase-1 n=1 Tax=Eumeta variegata TaxID=151549 RepID=A0A4C1Y5X0_EUMVA|nr:Aminoacylase-1 [Eumeta japonica]
MQTKDLYENVIDVPRRKEADNYKVDRRSLSTGRRINLPAVCFSGFQIDCRVCPGGTDARYFRMQKIAAFGFSPILNTPILLHAHDERINVEAFLKGIDVFENVLKYVANIS